MCYVVIRRRLSTFGTRELHDYEILLLIESRCLRFLYVKGIFYGAYAKLATKYLTHGIMGRRFPDGGLLRYRK